VHCLYDAASAFTTVEQRESGTHSSSAHAAGSHVSTWASVKRSSLSGVYQIHHGVTGTRAGNSPELAIQPPPGTSGYLAALASTSTSTSAPTAATLGRRLGESWPNLRRRDTHEVFVPWFAFRAKHWCCLCDPKKKPPSQSVDTRSTELLSATRSHLTCGN
jgi:hypothetical protein